MFFAWQFSNGLQTNPHSDVDYNGSQHAPVLEQQTKKQNDHECCNYLTKNMYTSSAAATSSNPKSNIDALPSFKTKTKPISKSKSNNHKSQTQVDGDWQILQPMNTSDYRTTVQLFNAYFDSILFNKDIMRKLPHTQFSETMVTKCTKLTNELDTLITNKKLSNAAHATLLVTLRAMQTHHYDVAMKELQRFLKHCKSNRKDPLSLHRNWITTFLSIVRTAKKYNL